MHTNINEQDVAEFRSVINILKMKLIIKYGPKVKQYWT